MTQEQKMAQEVRRIRQDLRLRRLDCAVRVEGKKAADERFWSETIKRALPEKKFKVYRYSNVPTEQSFGKQNVLKFKDFVAQDFILCVDSDYDYLLENPDLNQRFIFQTYVYAVENYQCYAPNLKNILQKRFDTEGVSDFDFEDFIARYSAAIHRLLIYSLYSVKTEGKNNQFTAQDCGQSVSFYQNENVVIDFQNLIERIDNQCIVHETKYDVLQDFQDFKRRITVLGLSETNAYLFLRGHNLLENVVIKLLENLGLPIRNAEFSRRRSLENGNQIAADYDSFLKQNSFENLLSSHTAFVESPFFQKIETDLRTAFSLN